MNSYSGDGHTDERHAQALAIRKRFDQGHVTIVATLRDLLSVGLVTPRALFDTIGFVDLARYLSPATCARALEAAVEAGRNGGAFADQALLDVVTPDALARALPLELLSDVIVALTSRIEPTPEVLGDEDLAPASLDSGRVVPPPSSRDDEHMEVSPESGSVELV